MTGMSVSEKRMPRSTIADLCLPVSPPIAAASVEEKPVGTYVEARTVLAFKVSDAAVQTVPLSEFIQVSDHGHHGGHVWHGHHSGHEYGRRYGYHDHDGNAGAIIGGLAVSVVMTVYLVPAVYLMIHGRKKAEGAVEVAS